ncbi:hypothetical protein LCGC14_2361390 [marine sediment metagenome]|uniref:Uncharacterized protein n=1 Tax=marine sediment metagenome TaxID=412755 RepID=A0A0F9CTV0_9ZZZZ
MPVEQDIRERLYNNAAVGAVVGSDVNARIYLGMLEQDVTYPAILVEKISALRSNKLAGGNAHYTRDLFQVTCWDPAYGTAKTLATKVIAALNGTTSPAITAGTEIDLHDSAAGVFHVATDFTVMHNP